ncbi:MAG: permease prefix domain 1-containing protein [Anaerolineae bacterium]
MFELKQQIAIWKNELQSENTLGGDDIEELATHLESTVDELLETGLSAEEAFYVSKHRLGGVRSLNTEFSKVNTAQIWRRRFMWLVSGYFLFSSIPLIVNLFITSVFAFEMKPLLFSSELFFGPDFLVPYPVYMIALLLLSGTLIYLLSEKSSFNNKPARQNYGYKAIALIFAGYIFLSTLNIGSIMMLPRFSSIATHGNIAASGSLFNFAWQIFLCVALLLTVLVSRRKENRPLFV